MCACTEQSVIINNPIGADASRETGKKRDDCKGAGFALYRQIRYGLRFRFGSHVVWFRASDGGPYTHATRALSLQSKSICFIILLLQPLTSFFTIGYLVYFNVGAHISIGLLVLYLVYNLAFKMYVFVCVYPF